MRLPASQQEGSPGQVTVLGSINMDVVLRVAHLPQPGETVLASAAARLPGGKGANQAVAAARAGAAVRLIGAVGADADGRALVDFLCGERIDCTEVREDAEQATGMAQVTVDRAGENQIVVAPGANAATAAGVGVRSGVLLAQLELPLAVVEAFLTQRAAGATTVLNAAPFDERARRLLALADVVVVNEVELAGYAGPAHASDVIAGARRLLTRDGQTVIVTRGGAGSVAVGPGGILAAPAKRVSVVDTTGAGDCFCGFLAAGLAAGRSLSSSIEWAHRAAAIAVGRHGAAASIPRQEEVNAEDPA